MSKPIVSVALMMLVEDGKVLLGAPVARYLPEFRDLQLAVEKKDAAGNRMMQAPSQPEYYRQVFKNMVYGAF